MEAMATMQLGKIAFTAGSFNPLVGVGIVGIGLAGVGIASLLNSTKSKINDVQNKQETVVSRAPGQQALEGKTRIIRLSDKQIIAEIEEAMKLAQIAFEIEIKDADREQPRGALVAGGIRNAQHRTLKLYLSGSLSGKFVVKPPKSMFEGHAIPALFLHQGPDPNDSNPGDSVGYVIYETSDNDRPRLLYLLAWSKPAKGSSNRVYVQAGLLPNILKLLDNEIEPARHLPNMFKMLENDIKQKLLAPIGADESYSYDPKTGAEAAAKIVNVSPDDNLALLGARFSRQEH